MRSRRLVLRSRIAVACAWTVLAVPLGATTSFASAPVQVCTMQNIQGFPISGDRCGGVTTSLCTPGALYKCNSGPRFAENNCTLRQACPTACQVWGGGSNDFCFTGARPLTLSTTSTLGGNDVGMTVELVAAHPSGAYTNLAIDRGDLVPGAYCGVPNIPADSPSISFSLPTAVVGVATPVSIFARISYAASNGASRMLIPVPQTLMLQPGGTEPPAPPLASFTVSPSTIAPGQYSVIDVVLSRMAPARGIIVGVTSSNPSVASVVPTGLPVVFGGCTTGGGAATIAAASAVPQTTVVTIGASSGAPGQTPLTQPLTVTSGCDPKTCLEVTGCGTLADGCGGTITCGCDFGQTCGGGGVPGQCGTPPIVAVASLTLSPTSVVGGGSSTGTVTLTLPAPPGGAGVFLSSSHAAAMVPSSVVVPSGQIGATFPISTSPVGATTVTTISASYAGTVNAALTITPGSSCVATTCAAQGKNCGTISNGCGGTLTCGSCTAPATCGGGGVPNVCGGGSGGTSQLGVTATGRSGERVLSSPAGISVATGSSGSASFATGTAITLSVTNGRDAIWSGGCSSGGQKQKTCGFTLNASTSVTANVQ